MSTVKTSRPKGRWFAGLGLLGVVVTITLAWSFADDNVTPAFGLFRFGKSAKREPKEKKEEPQAAKLPKPPDVFPAPPAQNNLPINNPNDPADPVLRRVEEAIRITKRRFLNAETFGQNSQHTPWQIMHGILALRNELELKSPRGMVNAIDFVSADPVFRGEHWFEATRYGGRGHPFSKPYYFEGHVNQFLALLTMANLPLDHRFGVADGKVVTMSDMIRHAQMMVNTNEEISWTLWFLTHYIEPDATWVNAKGNRWSMEALVRMQTEDEVTTAPCGGTHGLFAISYARNSYAQKYNGQLRGVWLEADQKIERYIAIARSTQNRDGSFSSHFFKEPGISDDPETRLKTSGHMLEWLMMALPQPQLNQNWVRAGVANVANDLVRFSNQTVDPGPLFHALHAIVLYRERMTPKNLSPVDAKPLLAQDPKEPRPEASPTTPKENPAAVEPKTLATDDPPRELPGTTVNPKAMPAETPTVTPEPMPPSVAVEPKPEVATTPPEKPEPMPGDAPMPPAVAESPLPDLPPPGTIGKTLPEKPVAVPPPPSPEDLKPIEPLLAADPPPSLQIVRRTNDGMEKPRGSNTSAPPPTTVKQPQPVVLPPLPLDPVDQPAPGAD